MATRQNTRDDLVSAISFIDSSYPDNPNKSEKEKDFPKREGFLKGIKTQSRNQGWGGGFLIRVIRRNMVKY